MIRTAVAFVVMIFVIGLSLVISYVAFDGIDTGIQESEVINATEKAFFTEQKNIFSNVWDYTFLTILIAALVGSLILTWAVSSNPALFFVLLMVVVVISALAGYLSNAFETVTEDAVLGAAALNFPIMSFVLNNYLTFMMSMMFLMLIVFFAKPQGGGF